MTKHEVEKSLKRYMKRKISYSFALLVTFLITGEISSAAVDRAAMLDMIKNEREIITARMEINEKRLKELNRDIVDLIKEGDYYVKTLDRSEQYFFPLTWEHRHSRKHRYGMKTPTEEEIPDTPPYIDTFIPDIPEGPNLPVVDIPTVDFEVDTIPTPSAQPDHGEIQEYTLNFDFNVVAPGEVPVNAVSPEINENLGIDSVGPEVEIAPMDENPEINKPGVQVTYVPRYVTLPTEPTTSQVTAPSGISIPTINVIANTGSQGRGGVDTIQTHNLSSISYIMAENFDSYTATDEVKVTFDRDSKDNSFATGEMTLGTYKKITVKEEGKPDRDEYQKDTDSFTLSSVENLKKLNAVNATFFISDTLAADTFVKGNYKFTANNGGLITIISLNPAMVGQDGGQYIGYSQNTGDKITIGNQGNSQHHIKKEAAYRVKTMEVGETNDKEKNKYDTTINMINSNASALVGIEHQEWDVVGASGSNMNNVDNSGDRGKKFAETYSVLWNKAKIDMTSGKNMIGIVIDVEHSGKDPTVYNVLEGRDELSEGSGELAKNTGTTYRKKYNNKTINDGEIIIGKGTTESIGISYEAKKVMEAGDHLRDDSYLGKITIEGKNSYGFRIGKIGESFNSKAPFTDKELAQLQRNREMTKFLDDVRVFGTANVKIEQGTKPKVDDKGNNIMVGDKEVLENVDLGKASELQNKEIASKISVGGSNNIGVSLGKSLSKNAAGYIKLSEEEEKILETKSGNFQSGHFLDGREAYDKGKVNPIANIHNLEIEVSGDSSIGFLRNRDYSNNNTNDMVITIDDYNGKQDNHGAIKSIDFAIQKIEDNSGNVSESNPEGSILIRSDMYGITLDENFGELSVGNNLKEETQNKANKNIIMQSTISSFVNKYITYKDFNDNTGTEHKEYITSIGDITNKAKVSSSADNMIGMMASGVYTTDNGYKYLNGYKGKNDIEKSLIVNSGKIDLTGKYTIGMAVIDDNAGILGNAEESTTKDTNVSDGSGNVENEEPKIYISVVTGERSSPDNTDTADYNVGIYNEGTFTIKDSAQVTAGGEKSVVLYNVKRTTAEQKGDETKPEISSYDTTGKIIIDGGTKFVAKDGAYGIINDDGTISAEKGFTLNVSNGSEEAIGIYSKSNIDNTQIDKDNIDYSYSNKAVINIGVDEDGNIVPESKSKITVENGSAGIVSVGSSTINIANAEITYSGKGYALHTDYTRDDDGNIIYKGAINFLANNDKQTSTLYLDGNAFGMEIEVPTKDQDKVNNTINMAGLNIVVNSNNVTVFNLTSGASQGKTIKTLLNTVGKSIEGATGIDITSNDRIQAKEGIDGYKIAMIENGTMSIDDSISQLDGESTNGFFYFKRFVGQRIRTTVEGGITVNSTMTTQHADKYFDGQIVGLEANSSANAVDNGEASITLKSDSKVIANRLDNIGIKTNESGNKENEVKDVKGAIGLYSNFGTITLESGSSVEVETEAGDLTGWQDHDDGKYDDGEAIKNDIVFDEAVGIYAVNGSAVNVSGGANVKVAGNESVGIYGVAYRDNLGDGVDKNEFGYTDDTKQNNKGQGTVNINNAGNITLTGKGSVGIYAFNNNYKIEDGKETDKIQSRDNVVVENTGTIEVGGSLVSADGTYTSSVGIYGVGATISNEKGTISVGSVEKITADSTEKNKGAVGIYADNSIINGLNLGNIALGNYSTGIMLVGGSKIDDEVKGTVTFTSKSNAENIADNVRIGLRYNGTEDNISFNVDMSGVNGGKAVVAENGSTVTFYGDRGSRDGVERTIKINGQNSRGMVALGNGTIVNKGTIDIAGDNNGANHSIGMLAMAEKGIINNQGIINVGSARGIGIHITNKDNNQNQITNLGNINLKTEHTIGLYLEKMTQSIGTRVIGNTGINMSDAKNSIGIYASKGTNLTIAEAINSGTTVNLGNGNILLYGAGKDTVITNNAGITVSNSYIDTDSGAEQNTVTNNRNVGVYLDEEAGYTGTGMLRVEKGAMGLYTNVGANGRTFDDTLNIVVDSQGAETIGVVLKGKKPEGNSEDVNENEKVTFNGGTIILTNSDTGNYQGVAQNKAVGVYADGVNINVDTGITVKYGENAGETSRGTGIYLTNKSMMTDKGTVSLTGAEVEVANSSSSVGIFYSASAGKTNEVNLDIQKGTTIGLYTETDLTNNGNIVTRTDNNGQVIGLYTLGKTITQSTGTTITLGENTLGIVAKDSKEKEDPSNPNSPDKIISTGNINFNGTLNLNGGTNFANQDYAVGLYNETGSITNTGTINVNGQNDIGIYSSGTVTNTGTINIGANSISGTGVYLSGSGASFTGEGGTINVVTNDKNDKAGIGIYLKDNAKLINTGTLILGQKDIGVYVLDGDITANNLTAETMVKIDTSKSTQAIAVVGATSRDSNGNPVSDKSKTELNYLDITVGVDSTGIYATDTGVKISNVKITAIKDVQNGTTDSTGIYLKACEFNKDTTPAHNHKPYEISDSEITIVKGVGILLGNNTKIQDADAAVLNLSGTTINVNSYIEDTETTKETGIGIYVQQDGTLNSSNIKITANGQETEAKGNIYNVKNGIGVFGASGSNVILGKDKLNLYGYSVGVFSNKGEIVLNKGVTATFQDREPDDQTNTKSALTGSVAYAINGKIESHMKIDTTGLDGVAGASVPKRADGFTALLGRYTDTEKHSIINKGDISIVGDHAIGIGAIGTGYNADNIIDNTGDIYISGWVEKTTSQSDDNTGNTVDGDNSQGGDTSSGKMAVGIYSTAAGIKNHGVITVGDNATGIYYSSDKGYNITSTKQDDKKTGNINLYGTGAIGAFLSGTAGNVELNDISLYTDSEGNERQVLKTLGIYMDNFKAKNFTIGNIKLNGNSMGIYATGADTEVKINGTSIVIGNAVGGEKGGAVGVYAENGAKVDVSEITGTNEVKAITAGEGGTAVYATGTDTKITIKNIDQLKVGAGNGALVYASNGGEVVLKEAVNDVIDVNGHFGFVLENGGALRFDENAKRIDKNVGIKVSNGGVGITIIGTSTGLLDLGMDISNDQNKIKVEVAGVPNVTEVPKEQLESAKYSVGVYYKDAESFSNADMAYGLNFVNLTQSGYKTVGIIFDNSYGEITRDINIGTENNSNAINSIGMIIRNNKTNKFTLNGNITVDGEGNIGLGVRDSNVETKGDITTIDGASGSYFPAGILLRSDKEVYNYNGTGVLKVGDGGTGILGTNYNIRYNGAVTVGTSAIGIYAQGTDTNTVEVKTTGNMTIGNNVVGKGGIGIYGENAHITVNSDNIKLGVEGSSNNNGNIGVLSKYGDVTYNVKNTEIHGTPVNNETHTTSIGIYKEGTGTITVGKEQQTWTLGSNTMGIVVNNRDAANLSVAAINVSKGNEMNLGLGAIGIYAHGITTVNHDGNIVVGQTHTYDGSTGETNSSIGIYMVNEFSRGTAADGTNSGTITVEHAGSIGVQAVGNVEFTNKGTIEVSNGGIGVYATYGATIINAEGATIKLDENENSIGMYASGKGSTGKASTIINNGTIEANGGVGMYIENGAKFENNGEIIVNNGIGILGTGNISNAGKITITGTGKDVVNGERKDGAIVVTGPNVVEVNENYYRDLGGILETTGEMKLNNPMVNIADENFGFSAKDISGSIKLAPEVAISGNGYSFKLPDEITSNNINVNTFPLFKEVEINDESYIQKVPYRDILKDSSFNPLYDGMDEALKNLGAESEILKQLNKNLGTLYYTNPDLFTSTLEAAADEAKGNIYSHVQSRMQDINRAFDNSFDEMEQSFNFSKDTDKYSVVYTGGDYKNSEPGLPDYEYNIAGLMYMKEYENTRYNDKYGYSFGLTGSRFKFDDMGGSKERVISLIAGAHNVRYFTNSLNLLTKADIGYNRHMAERKMAILGIENDADYNSFHVGLENKLRKTLYQNLENEVGANLGFDLEYGKFDDIKEDGILELKVKDNDYFNSKLKAELTGTGRIYLGNDWTMKFTGNAGYSYNFGNNYSANEAKIKDTSTGYYSLMSEVKSRDVVYAKAGVGFERLNYLGVTLEGEMAKDFRRDEDYWRVSLRFNYKFGEIDPKMVIPNITMFGNFFDFDKSEIKPEGKEKIEETTALLNKYNVKGTLVIEGHTDWVGTEEYNQKLSERRANSVEKEIRKNIAKEENIKYDTKGYGELRPIADNRTKEGRAKNRRVEVKFEREKPQRAK